LHLLVVVSFAAVWFGVLNGYGYANRSYTLNDVCPF